MRNLITKIIKQIITMLSITNLTIKIVAYWNYLIINNLINPIFCIKNIKPCNCVNLWYDIHKCRIIEGYYNQKFDEAYTNNNFTEVQRIAKKLELNSVKYKQLIWYESYIYTIKNIRLL